MDEIKKTQTMSATPQTNEVDPVFAQIEGELKTRFELLPTELQQVILSSDYQMHLFEVAKKHKLTYEKLGQLELETTMVILGMTPPDEYKADIAEQMNLTGEALDNVVTEINEKVFAPIREKLMSLYSEEEVKKGEELSQKKIPTDGISQNPYREPIGQNSGINTSAIPTFDKNTFDAKKEMGANGVSATPNPVTSSLDAQPINTAPLVQPAVAVTPKEEAPKLDPYRETPDETLVFMPINMTPTHQDTTAGNTQATQEFLKTIPTLGSSATSRPPAATTESALEIANSLGSTHPMLPDMKPQSKAVGPVQNQEEKLKNIADLKNTLSAKINPQTEAVVTPPVTPQVPIVTKEIVSPRIATMVNGVTTQFAPIPEIPSISKEMTQTPPAGQTPGVASEKFTPEETGELIRNIKLQISENQNNRAQETQPDVVQKIDALIDFKKAGTFMKTATEANTHVGDNFSNPLFTPKNTSPEVPVSPAPVPQNIPLAPKKGFFASLANLFGSKKESAPTTTQVTEPVVKSFSGMPTHMHPQATGEAQAPSDIDNVKIFDEVTVVKK